MSAASPRTFRTGAGLAFHVHIEERIEPRHLALGKYDRHLLAVLVDAMQVALQQARRAALAPLPLVHYSHRDRAGRHPASCRVAPTAIVAACGQTLLVLYTVIG